MRAYLGGEMYRTFIVLGNMRGGTSMMAGLLRILGINMGDNIDEENHEDLDLQHRHPIHLRDLIARKNEEHNEWGWKDPLLIDNIYDMIELCPLRQPTYIVVFRDAVATAEGLMREEGWSADYAFNHVARQTEKLFDFCREYSPIVVSYEKALCSPEDFIHTIAAKLAITLDDDTIQRAMEFIKPGYRNVDCSP